MLRKVVQYRGHTIEGFTTKRVENFLGGSSIVEDDHVTIDGIDVSNSMPLVGGLDNQMKYAETMVDRFILDQVEQRCVSMSFAELIDYHRNISAQIDSTTDRKIKTDLESAHQIIFNRMSRVNYGTSADEQQLLDAYMSELKSKESNQ